MKKRDYLIIGFTLPILAINLSDWQITFDYALFDTTFAVICRLVFIMPLIYVMNRAKHFDRKWKIGTRVMAIALSVALLIFVFSKAVAFHPSKSNYLTLYVNPTYPSEFVEITHHHTVIHSWNSMRHVIDYSSWGFQIERYIEQDELNGKWDIQADNPYHEISGIQELEFGKVKLKK